MNVLGVDPGISGGLALLSPSGGLLFAEAMPVIRTAVPLVDVGEVDRMLRGHEVRFAFVERAQAMPQQGVSSAFNYGTVFGSLCAALMALDIGVEFVQAAKWKRDAGLTADKRGSFDLVRQLYPSFPLKRSEDGIAEAILIARHGLRMLDGPRAPGGST